MIYLSIVPAAYLVAGTRIRKKVFLHERKVMNFVQWLTQQLPQNISGPAAFFLLVSIASYMLGRFRQRQEREKIRKGHFNTTVLVQACVLRPGNNKFLVLLLRNLMPPFRASELSIPDIHLKMLEKKASRTTVVNPEIHLDENDPDENHLLHMVRSHVMGACNQLHGPLENWVVFITSEVPGKFVKRNFIRIILIRRTDLDQFLSWQDARKIRLEDDGHWFRILTMHILAHKKNPAILQVPVDRAWIPVKEVLPDWENETRKDALSQVIKSIT